MRLTSIRKYLRPQAIMGRKSTFSNAFASALAPFDAFDLEAAREALIDLGQDPDGDLSCSYCGNAAQTWDHVFNRVTRGEFSGHGHRIRNLVPCCRTCNERKGQRPWREYLALLAPVDEALRVSRFEAFLSKIDPASQVEARHLPHDDLARFLAIRSEVFALLKEADELAIRIRSRAPGSASDPEAR